MKHTLLLAFSLGALAVAGCKSSDDPDTTKTGWVKGSSGTTQDILGMTWVTSQNGYSVGKNGMILHTTDAGDNWQVQTSGTGENLYRISFSDAQTGVAGGNNGTLVRTTDGGATWSVVATDAFETTAAGIENLRDLKFDGSGQVLAVGGVGNSSSAAMQGFALRSTDAGLTWSRLPFGGSTHFSGTLYSVGTIPNTPATFTVVGLQGQALKTTNSGSSWFPASGAFGSDLYAVDFADASTGVAVSYQGMIYRTTNGGETWIMASTSNTTPLRAVKMVSATEAWASGEQGVILHSTDGGASWSQASIPDVSTTWNMIAVRDAKHVAFIGDAGQLWWRNS